jgi:hypothetical protein
MVVSNVLLVVIPTTVQVSSRDFGFGSTVQSIKIDSAIVSILLSHACVDGSLRFLRSSVNERSKP